jgi:hypothetical protein
MLDDELDEKAREDVELDDVTDEDEVTELELDDRSDSSEYPDELVLMLDVLDSSSPSGGSPPPCPAPGMTVTENSQPITSRSKKSSC